MLGDHAKSPFGVVPDVLNGCTHRVGVIPRFLPFLAPPSMFSLCLSFFPQRFRVLLLLICLLFSLSELLSPFVSRSTRVSLPPSPARFFSLFLANWIAPSFSRFLPSVLPLFSPSITLAVSVYLPRSVSSCRLDSLSNFLITPAEQRWPNQRVSQNKRRAMPPLCVAYQGAYISHTL